MLRDRRSDIERDEKERRREVDRKREEREGER